MTDENADRKEADDWKNPNIYIYIYIYIYKYIYKDSSVLPGVHTPSSILDHLIGSN
jgi:hypothetical protein